MLHTAAACAALGAATSVAGLVLNAGPGVVTPLALLTLAAVMFFVHLMRRLVVELREEERRAKAEGGPPPPQGEPEAGGAP